MKQGMVRRGALGAVAAVSVALVVGCVPPDGTTGATGKDPDGVDWGSHFRGIGNSEATGDAGEVRDGSCAAYRWRFGGDDDPDSPATCSDRAGNATREDGNGDASSFATGTGWRVTEHERQYSCRRLIVESDAGKAVHLCTSKEDFDANQVGAPYRPVGASAQATWSAAGGS